MSEKKSLVAKLVEIVKEIDHVEKSGRNEFQKYNYVRAADVAWMVRKALSERNVYLVSDVVEIRNYEIPAKEGFMQAVDVKMEFSFHDADNLEAAPIVLHSYGTGTDKGDKAVYKAMTGALKYGLRHAFIIPDESDPEADETVDKATAAAHAKAIGEQKVAQLKANGNGHAAPPAIIPNDDLAPLLQKSIEIENQKKAKLNLPPIPAPEPPKPRVDARGDDVDDVVGEIKAVKDLTTKEKRPYKSVTIVDIFGEVLELSAFDNFKLSDGTLFQYLVAGAVGQEATFTYVAKSKNGKTYRNIINVSRIGSHRWDDGFGVLEAGDR